MVGLNVKYMIVEYINGCTCDTLNVDGKETIDMDIRDVRNIIKRLTDNENDIGTLQSILITLVESQGDFEDLGTCEQCGDWITKYTVNLD
jgi:hypothetical protein